jgi:hypothetical protein
MQTRWIYLPKLWHIQLVCILRGFLIPLFTQYANLVLFRFEVEDQGVNCVHDCFRFFNYRRVSRSLRNELLQLPVKWGSGAALYGFSVDKRRFFLGQRDGESETTSEGGNEKM